MSAHRALVDCTIREPAIQHRRYFTYNGGPVFDLTTNPATAPPAAGIPVHE